MDFDWNKKKLHNEFIYSVTYFFVSFTSQPSVALRHNINPTTFMLLTLYLYFVTHSRKSFFSFSTKKNIFFGWSAAREILTFAFDYLRVEMGKRVFERFEKSALPTTSCIMKVTQSPNSKKQHRKVKKARVRHTAATAFTSLALLPCVSPVENQFWLRIHNVAYFHNT